MPPLVHSLTNNQAYPVKAELADASLLERKVFDTFRASLPIHRSTQLLQCMLPLAGMSEKF